MPEDGVLGKTISPCKRCCYRHQPFTLFLRSDYVNFMDRMVDREYTELDIVASIGE